MYSSIVLRSGGELGGKSGNSAGCGATEPIDEDSRVYHGIGAFEDGGVGFSAAEASKVCSEFMGLAVSVLYARGDGDVFCEVIWLAEARSTGALKEACVRAFWHAKHMKREEAGRARYMLLSIRDGNGELKGFTDNFVQDVGVGESGHRSSAVPDTARDDKIRWRRKLGKFWWGEFESSILPQRRLI